MPVLPLYRNQSIELHSKSIDWFLAFNGLNNLNLNNYSFEFTPTETSPGGTLLFIANHLS